MISRTQKLIKLALYSFINLLIKPEEETNPKSLLLIRLDAIGDYVLFRNYIEVIKKSYKYKNYEITLLGNIAWKNITYELDKEYIHNFIWLDRQKFRNNFLYRYKKLKEIVSCGYEIVLSPVYSRDFFYTDNIIKLVNAKHKIGSIGDTSNISVFEKKISDKFYTRLIDAEDKIMFEFYRNKEFFEGLLQKKIKINKPTIKLKPIKFEFKLPEKFAVLFIGASNKYRQWDIKNFAQIAKLLKNKYGYEIVLCGDSTNIHQAIKFKKYFSLNYFDLVGKTSLLDLLCIIKQTDLIISNETSIPHFAVALDIKKIFVISNGNHFGRFTPYPRIITKNYHVIFHPKIKKYQDNYKKFCNIYGIGSNLNINKITVEMLINKINNALGKP